MLYGLSGTVVNQPGTHRQYNQILPAFCISGLQQVCLQQVLVRYLATSHPLGVFLGSLTLLQSPLHCQNPASNNIYFL